MKEHTKDFFKAVSRSGRLFGSKHLSIKAIKENSSRPEVRVVVSKKTVSQAVSRNRLRRRIRGIFEEISPGSLQVIFYAKVGSEGLSFKELQEEVIFLVESIHKQSKL